MTASPGGADLARMALASAKAAARGTDTRATKTPNRRRAAGARQNGRDPVNLGSALGALLLERGWQSPAAGGSVLDAWPAIASAALAEHVTAVAFDAETGRLDLAADSSAWAFQARLDLCQLIAKANQAAGRDVVRDIRVLPPGRARAVQRPTPAELPPSPPVRPAAHCPPPGYLHLRQLLQQARSTRVPDPRIAAATARQESAPPSTNLPT